MVVCAALLIDAVGHLVCGQAEPRRSSNQSEWSNFLWGVAALMVSALGITIAVLVNPLGGLVVTCCAVALYFAGRILSATEEEPPEPRHFRALHSSHHFANPYQALWFRQDHRASSDRGRQRRRRHEFADVATFVALVVAGMVVAILLWVTLVLGEITAPVSAEDEVDPSRMSASSGVREVQA